MIQDLNRVERLFNEALVRTGGDRSRFLEESCEGDPVLRRRIERMIEADERCSALDGDSGSEPAEPSLVGQTVADFRIDSVIGSGGMGTVYEAEQEYPRRHVALKVLRHGIASRTALRRFRYEAQILAGLRHPGIAQIYAAGVHGLDGMELPYFAMELVPGSRTLLEYANEHDLPVQERLTLFQQVCLAVQHGHQRGVIHRDLKPANVLVDAQGRPKIIDFGVARSTDSDLTVTTLQTQVGQLIGTLQYMSPEQCDADPNELDIRSDVYSLGVVLYELLTDELPYDASGMSLYRATRIIRESEPQRLSAIDRRLGGDIETIVRKALEKGRDRRYQSAGELADDIGRYLQGAPIQARPPTFGYYAAHLLRRHRAETMSIAATLVLLIGVSVGVGVWSFGKGRRSQRLESEATAREFEATRKVREAALATAQAALSLNDVGTARAFLDRVGVEDRGWEWDYLFDRSDVSDRTLADRDDLLVLPDDLGPPFVATVFPMAEDRILIGVKSRLRGRLRILEQRGVGEELLPGRVVDVDLLPPGDSSWATTGFDLALLPDRAGLRALVVGVDSRFGVIDLDSEYRVESREISTLSLPDTDAYGGGYLSPTGRYAAIPAKDGTIALFDRESSSIDVLRGHTLAVESIEFDETETMLLSASTDLSARLWDVATHRTRAVFRGHTYYLSSARFQPGGDLIATSSVDGTIRLWDRIASEEGYRRDGSHPGVLIHTFAEHDDGVADVSFRADGRRLASVSADRNVRLWEIETDAEIFQFGDPRLRTWVVGRYRSAGKLRGHQGKGNEVWFDPRDRFVISYDLDGVMKIWASTSIPDVISMEGHTSSVTALAADPSRPLLVSGGGNSNVILWDTERGIPTTRIRWVPESPIEALAFHPTRPILVVASASGRLGFYGVDDPERPAPLFAESDRLIGAPEAGAIRSIDFSSDGSRLVTGRDDGSIEIWAQEGERWTPVDRFPLFEEPVGAVAFLDRDRVAAGRRAAELRQEPRGRVALAVVDLNSRRTTSEIVLGQSIVDLSYTIEWGRLIAATVSPGPGESQSIGEGVVWSVQGPALREVGRLVGHSAGVLSVTTMPGQRRVFTGSADRTVQVWDSETLQPLLTLREHSGGINDLAVLADGRTLASASAGSDGTDNTVKLWHRTRSRETRRRLATATAEWIRVRTVVFQLRQSELPDSAIIQRVVQHLEPRQDEIAVRVIRFYQGDGRIREILEIATSGRFDSSSARRLAEWGRTINRLSGSEVVRLETIQALERQ
ncbi:MAG: protein kinase [Planctomycetes bacterium]|nr:protein kinase [Planctomycetota bacterium]